MGSHVGRALGDVLPRRRSVAAASEPALRGRARRARAVRGAGHHGARRRAPAARPDHRRLCARLRHRPRVLRAVSGARSAARLSAGGPPHHGDAAVAAADACGHRFHHGRAQNRRATAELMADQLPPLDAEIRKRIAIAGPMPVGQYMRLCLTHPDYGYYMTRDPFGTLGDFTTSPEISQMFGELIGLWAAAVWKQMDSPQHVRLIELGPGRGTMMLDALRAAKSMPGFRNAIELHLVEISPVLEQRQRQNLESSEIPVTWHKSLDEVPQGPSIILANEFFDALPVQQAVMCADGWHERVIKIDENDRLAFTNG